jgi:predicted RNase H-like nuclease (RuvC/YqgF family)
VSAVPTWLSIAALAAGPASAAYAVWRGTRDKAVNAAVAAATAPFTTGKEVASEAEIVLQLRAAALEEAKRQQEALRTRNAELEARNKAQAGQITDLYTKYGEVTAENAELRQQVQKAGEREARDRERIETLEADLAEVRKQIGLGGP